MIVTNSNRFFNWINTYPVSLFLGAVLFFRIGLSYIFSLASEFIRHNAITKESLIFSSLMEELFVVVAVGPLAETFLFQYLPFYFLKGKWADIYILLLAAILFGCGHFYNSIYFLNALCAGILYGCIYASKARVGKGFLYTWLLHTLYNGFAFIMNQV